MLCSTFVKCSTRSALRYENEPPTKMNLRGRAVKAAVRARALSSISIISTVCLPVCLSVTDASSKGGGVLLRYLALVW